MGSILVVNAGSTSLKLSLVDARERSEPVASLDSVEADGVDAVAHRVVHGGAELRDPVVIDAEVMEQIKALERLAPLHNRPALEGIEAARQAFPEVPHVAVFDTAFHATMPPEATTYPLPRRWREEWGVRRFGFHGLSCAWAARRVPELLGRDPGELRLVVCHLGGGCSVSALRGGESLETTMGFSPLEGIPMTTRSGSIDPSAVIYLLSERGLGPAELQRALESESGLAGLAGHGGDLRAIEAAARDGDPAAEMAIAVFAHRIAGAVAAMAAAAGGLDAVAFTAGIGENSALVRERVCARLGFLGLELDRERNLAAAPDCTLSAPGSAVEVVAIRAREDLVAAAAARALLGTAVGERG